MYSEKTQQISKLKIISLIIITLFNSFVFIGTFVYSKSNLFLSLSYASFLLNYIYLSERTINSVLTIINSYCMEKIDSFFLNTLSRISFSLSFFSSFIHFQALLISTERNYDNNLQIFFDIYINLILNIILIIDNFWNDHKYDNVNNNEKIYFVPKNRNIIICLSIIYFIYGLMVILLNYIWNKYAYNFIEKLNFLQFSVVFVMGYLFLINSNQLNNWFLMKKNQFQSKIKTEQINNIFNEESTEDNNK